MLFEQSLFIVRPVARRCQQARPRSCPVVRTSCLVAEHHICSRDEPGSVGRKAHGDPMILFLLRIVEGDNNTCPTALKLPLYPSLRTLA